LGFGSSGCVGWAANWNDFGVVLWLKFLSLYNFGMTNLKGKGLRKYPLMKQLKKYVLQKAKSDFAVVDGNKMYLGQDDLRLSINGVYEPLATEWVKKNVKKGDTVVDVGANIGYYTLVLAKLVGEQGRVFAFEPDSTNYKLLRKNIEINNYKNIHTENYAIADYEGHAKLFLSKTQMGMHRIYPSKYCSEHYLNVKTRSLDSYFIRETKKAISFVKIDVEGSEFKVINGMKDILKNPGLKMLLEFVPFDIRECGDDPSKLVSMLDEFKIYRTIQAENKIIPFEGVKLAGCNLICERSL